MTMSALLWKRGSAVCVAILAMIAGALLSLPTTVPHRELDWEGTVIPMAQAYARRNAAAADTDSSSNTTAATDFSSSSSTSSSLNSTLPLQGIHVLITGATNGIGLSLARALTKLGATVIAVGRSKARLESLQAELGPSLVLPVQADLADLESVARAADEIISSSKLNKIDFLINNAGMHDLFSWDTMLGWKNFSTPQGYDRVFTVNYLSHFLLTEKLAKLVSRSSRPTVVQISSSFHWAVDGSDLVVETLSSSSSPSTTTRILKPPIASQPGGSRGLFVFRSQRSYANSKLAQIYHARSLQKFHPEFSKSNSSNNNSNNQNKARVVSVCPAWVATQIAGSPGSFSHSMVHALGFPADGWGIASALHAMFADGDGNSNNDMETAKGYNQYYDYYSNTDFFNLFHVVFTRLPPSWSYQWGLRDGLAYIFAGWAMVGQRFLPNVGPSLSSPESYYDATIGDTLYQWSYQAVAPYL